jgi:anion-transporting  ArsA/GET3 family ATPase
MNVQLFEGRRLLITLGPGGVGKTTLAAVLGLEAARLGKKALVLTIDPALRLADALGIDRLAPGRVKALSRRELAAAGIAAREKLKLLMLETATSLKQAVNRQLPPGEARERVLRHPFFARLQQDLPGVREYAAFEEILFRLEQEEVDLVVVDTPPSNHALDFLSAPQKMLEVIDRRAWRWLVRPALLASRAGGRLLDFAGGYLARTVSRFTGWEFLEQLAGFIDLTAVMVGGLRRRCEEFLQLARSPASLLCLVTAAEQGALEEAGRLQRALSGQGWDCRLCLVNRLMPPPLDPPLPEHWRRRLQRLLAAENQDCLERLDDFYRLQQELYLGQQARLKEFSRQLPERCRLIGAPLLDVEVCDLRALGRLRQEIFGG